MGKLVYIMGKSGTGKSRSMKNIPADQFGLINPEGKDLPFGKDAPAFKVERVTVDTAADIVDAIKSYAKRFKIVVVDDFQTVMTNEFMRRSSENGYQKWTDIGKHAWEIAEAAKSLADDVVVYILCHTEENDNGGEKIKTLGKLLDQNVVLESKSTIVLKTGVDDGRYYFFTQNNGKDTVKSPEGMFPAYSINNDLKYVDDAIRNYYDLKGAKTDAEMQQEHADAAGTVDKPSTGRKSRKKDAEAGETAVPAAQTETVQTVSPSANAGTRRTREQIAADNQKKLDDYEAAKEAAVDAIADGREEIPFDEVCEAMDSVPKPELEKVPRRTRADRATQKAAEAQQGVLTEDTYFYVASDDNYVLKHAGDTAPEGGQQITKEQFGEGLKRIASEGAVSASATTGSDPFEGAMNPPEQRTRRRRTR